MGKDRPPTQVLVADDYPDMAELLAEVIVVASAVPVEVAVAFDGAQALALAVSRPFHCVIMDLDMPVLDGMSAALEIRLRLGPRAPLLVAVTGNPAHLSSPCTRGIFDHTLDKPTDIEELLVLIASSHPRIKDSHPVSGR